MKRQDLVGQLWFGCDPLSDPISADFGYTGRDSHPYYERAVNETKPMIVVVVGVWKGDIVVSLADAMRARGIEGTVIAVDTWLGAWDHWFQEELFKQLDLRNPTRSLYQSFLSNIRAHGLEQWVLPLPQDTSNAFQILKRHNVGIDILVIDGARDFGSVNLDLRNWWSLLLPNGVLIGDDYHAEGPVWEEVREAFQSFFRTSKLENLAGKCYVRKDVCTGGPHLLR